MAPNLHSRVVLHASTVCAMAYGYNALVGLSISDSINSQYGGHFQFLTIQGLAVACLTMLVGLLADFFPAVTVIRTAKRALFIVAMPTATMVSSIYWTLLLTSPHLIIHAAPAEALEAVMLPMRIDLCLHAVPCLALLTDFMVFERKYGRSVIVYTAPLLSLLYTVSYAWWVELCATHNGKFPYPFLTFNPFEVRVFIYAGVGALACVSFYALNALHPKSH
ncbi:FAR-17a/AIG1-like protein [Mycena pura]|uniref:FAR-17a/AIG1-like protein n=1 Tax=Mycena pura TaxID=153505 RepID=A0AAD6VSL0_9AGAR|nr:FAR-17a/AIG1-like protein [Mycena pura]